MYKKKQQNTQHEKQQNTQQGFWGKRISILLLIVMVFTCGATPAYASTPEVSALEVSRSEVSGSEAAASETQAAEVNEVSEASEAGPEAFVTTDVSEIVESLVVSEFNEVMNILVPTEWLVAGPEEDGIQESIGTQESRGTQEENGTETGSEGFATTDVVDELASVVVSEVDEVLETFGVSELIDILDQAFDVESPEAFEEVESYVYVDLDSYEVDGSAESEYAVETVEADPNKPLSRSKRAVETVVDVASAVDSAIKVGKDPSLENVGMFAWDLVAMAVPGMPGSWVKKGIDKAADLNKIHHLFGKKQHNLDELLTKNGGDEVKAYMKIQNAIQQHVDANNLTGLFQNIVVYVDGMAITVRGKVMDGKANIGTAYIP